MEKQENIEREQKKTEALARKMAKKILSGRDHVTLNPRLYGIGGYRLNTDFYELTRSKLETEGVITEIKSDTIPSGSDADAMTRHTLHVISRQSSQQ
jgi:hypothetical protein